MIIGVIGPVPQDITEVVDAISEENHVQCVDSLSVLRLSDRKTMGSLTTKQYHQQYALKKWESSLGVVIVTGNILLNEEICSWLLKTGNKVVITSREHIEDYDKDVIESTARYWDDNASQKYNLETRFRMEHSRLSKVDTNNLYLIDLSSEDTDELERLLNDTQEFSESYDSTGYSTEELIDIINTKRSEEDMSMTMEESIKKAMRELGMDVDDTDTDIPVKKEAPKPKEVKKPEPKKEDKKPVKAVKTLEPKEDFMNKPEPEEESDEPSSIFVKLTDNTMALLIPEGLTLEKQTIAGMNFNVATVSIPDLDNRKLQELTITSAEEKTETKKKPEPIVKPKEVDKAEKIVRKPVVTTADSSDLSDLQAEKQRLDAEIKKYRAEGDTDKVNELRKQRRAIRNKINGMK